MITNTTQVNSAQLPNSVSVSGLSSDQTQFMTLLVAQMRNQDPLNPMDNNQMSSQMAMLNMVNGINSLNKTLDNMASNQQLGDSLKATDLIGHKVQFKSDAVSLQNGNASFTVDLKGDSQTVSVSLLDKNGALVRTIPMGSRVAGLQDVNWDGLSDSGQLLPDGQYTVKIDAQQNGQSVSATALETDTVSNLVLSGGVATLQLSRMGVLGLSDIRTVY